MLKASKYNNTLEMDCGYDQVLLQAGEDLMIRQWAVLFPDVESVGANCNHSCGE